VSRNFVVTLQVVHLSNTISSERLSLQKVKSRLEVFFQVHNITEFVAKIFSKLDSKTQNLMVVQYCTKLLSTPVHMMLVLNTMNSWPPRAAMFDHCSTWTGHYCSWFGTVFPNLQRTLKYLGYVAQLGSATNHLQIPLQMTSYYTATIYSSTGSRTSM
jgi:hypothetical protein